MQSWSLQLIYLPGNRDSVFSPRLAWKQTRLQLEEAETLAEFCLHPAPIPILAGASPGVWMPEIQSSQIWVWPWKEPEAPGLASEQGV